MNAVDTNVLFYARDPRDVRMRGVAADLIASLRDGVLIWQVACEYLAASQKLEPYGYSRLQALADIKDLSRVWKTVLPDWATLDHAEDLRARFSLSFWDSLLIAACLEANVSRLFTEDLQSGMRIGSVEIVDPFK